MKKIIALTSTLILASSLSAYATGSKQMAPAKVNMDDVSYIIGFGMGENFKQHDINLSTQSLNEGLNAGLAGKKSKFDDAKAKAIMAGFQQEMIQKAKAKLKAETEKNTKQSAEFITALSKTEGVKKVETGVYYRVIKQGKGTVPSKTDIVTVNYKGTTPAGDYAKNPKDGKAKILDNKLIGKVFDSSFKRKTPATFPLNQVIPCWTDALSKVATGSTIILYCSPNKAYGANGPAQIGPNQVLSFKINLLKVKKVMKKSTDKAEKTKTK